MKTALIFGSGGLIGSYLMQELLDHEKYRRVHAFVRKPLLVSHPKLEIHQVDFDALEAFSDLIRGDDLYCCLGTTMKKAGSREAFERVDLQYPLKIAEIASRNQVGCFLLVSSIGADIRSANFYLRTKGKVEDGVKKIMPRVLIFRPSMLLGKRNEFRFGESLGKALVCALQFLFLGKLRKYRGIHAHTVARAMIRLAMEEPEGGIYESDHIQIIGKRP